jgi:hypothetical protein
LRVEVRRQVLLLDELEFQPAAIVALRVGHGSLLREKSFGSAVR